MVKQIFISETPKEIRSLKHRIRSDVLIVDDIQSLIRLGEVLSSKTRLLILYYLAKNDGLSIKELSKITGLPLPVVSKHVKKLEEEGLIISGLRNGHRGLCKVVKKRVSRIVINL